MTLQRIMKMGYSYLHSHYCEECETRFDSVKYDARYCSSTCRSKAHRKAKDREKALLRAKDAVIALGGYCGHSDALEVMRELERRLSKMVEEGETRIALRY